MPGAYGHTTVSPLTPCFHSEVTPEVGCGRRGTTILRAPACWGVSQKGGRWGEDGYRRKKHQKFITPTLGESSSFPQAYRHAFGAQTLMAQDWCVFCMLLCTG